MNRKFILILILLLVIVCVQVYGFDAYIDSPLTIDDSKTVFLGEGIDFSSNVINGGTGLNYSWVFCTDSNDCQPTTSNSQDPGLVNFTTPGTFIVEYNVTNGTTGSGYDNVSYDVFTVIVDMVEIYAPETETGWAGNETIAFVGRANTSLTETIDYVWNFGDGDFNYCFGLNPGEDCATVPPNKTYSNTGFFLVNLTATQDSLYGLKTDVEEIIIYIVNPIPLEFNCTTRYLSCLPGELDLLRAYLPYNAHARGFDHENYTDYEYPVCCLASALRLAVKNEPPSSGSVYAALTNDSESLLGGSHIGGSGILSYYYLTSGIGAGTECAATDTNNCSTLSGNKTCVYQYLNEGPPIESSHFSNCTLPGQPTNATGTMCCEIAEDCTNNVDDNSNNWTDTSDNDFKEYYNSGGTNGYVCGEGMVCGISEQIKFDQGCSAWMEDYYVAEYDFYDFRYLGRPFKEEPYANRTGVAEGHILVDYFNDSCRYIQDASGTIHLDTTKTNSDDCDLQPDFHYSANFNATAASLGVNSFELVNRCLYFHCSKGGFPDTNPLPAFVSDMEENADQTRHVCPYGEYWSFDIFTGWSCRDFTECYLPSNPETYDCKYDYLTEFSSWMNDSYPNDPVQDMDCFDTVSEINERACCPVFKYGENTYEYTDISYYMAS
ncbi:hypothetical protein ACFLTH_04280 [Bacteroidota bacterium]